MQVFVIFLIILQSICNILKRFLFLLFLMLNAVDFYGVNLKDYEF